MPGNLGLGVLLLPAENRMEKTTDKQKEIGSREKPKALWFRNTPI